MEEQIVSYDLNQKNSFWRNKQKGLFNHYFRIKRTLRWKLHLLLNPIEVDFTKIAPNSIPILINNFNRLETLRLQIEWLQTLSSPISILIIDNDSSYPPLLEFYKTLKANNVQVVYLGANTWKKGAEHVAKMLHQFPKFVLTDPDLLPNPNNPIPSDVLAKLSLLLDQFPQYNHVGISLEINDIPDNNPLKIKILNHELQFWEKLLPNSIMRVFEANIDSTFAMYRQSSKIEDYGPSLRTDRPYTLHHVDWYINPQKLTEEYKYYLETCASCATWANEIRQIKT